VDFYPQRYINNARNNAILVSIAAYMNRKTFFISLLFAIAPSLAFASFVPGQTLDPQCLPSDSTCIVIGIANNIAGSFTATSTNATSTFAGGVNIGNGGLLFDRSTGFVGIGTLSPSQLLEVSKNQNGGTNFQVTNSNAGTGAFASLLLSNGSGLTTSAIQLFGNNFASSNEYVANAMLIENNNAAGLGISTIFGGDIRLYTGASSAGSQKMVIKNGGNVGIGTINPGYLFDVNGIGHFTSFVDAANFVATSTTATSTFAGGINIGNGGLLYDPNGYAAGVPQITFGSTTPTAFLMNEQDTAAFQIRRNGSAFGPEIRMMAAFGTTLAPTLTTAGQFLGSYEFMGYTGAGTGVSGYSRSALISALAADNASSTNSDAHLVFFTTPLNTTSAVERLRITASGNIGIGTSTPWAMLSVSAPNNAANPQFVVASTTAVSMIVTNAGNVGIGTVSPTSRLDITGVNTIATAGSEMISATADRDFSSDTGKWTGTNWSVSAGVDTHTAGANALTFNNSGLSSVPANGHVYQVTFTANTTVIGTLTPSIGGVNGVAVGQVTGSLAQTQIISATGAGALTFTPSAAWTGTLDNISVVEITPSTPIQTMRNSENGAVSLEFRAGGSGLDNTIIGRNAGQSMLNVGSGYLNGLFGSFAGNSITSGFQNIVVGGYALLNTTIGSRNVAIGEASLLNNTTGGTNTAVGDNVMGSNVSGSNNVAIGGSALFRNVASANNTVVGYQAALGATNSFNQNNVILGYQAGLNIGNNANNNTLLGYSAGSNLTTGAGNIVIGYNLSATSSTATNSLTIGNLIFGIGLDGSGTSVSTGNIGIATTSPWRTFSVNGTVSLAGLTTDSADSKTLCLTSNNEVVANTGSTCITSSQRFKHDINPLDTTSGLTEIMHLNPVSFIYNDNIGVAGTQVGFIAEQIQQVDPRLVVYDASNTPFSVKYENMTAILAKAVQDLANVSGVFQTNLVAWLANSSNGITSIFAHNGNFDTTNTQKLCIGNTCLTEAQLQQLMQAQNGIGGSAPIAPPADTSSNSDSSSTPNVMSTPTTPVDASSTTQQN
jgi:hypothetical protein